MLFPCFLLILRHHIQKIYQNYIILFPPDLLWISNEYTCISMYVELVCILQIFEKMVLTFKQILSLWEREGSSFGTSSKSRCFSVYIKPTTRPKENMSVLGCSLSFSSSIDFELVFFAFYQCLSSLDVIEPILGHRTEVSRLSFLSFPLAFEQSQSPLSSICILFCRPLVQRGYLLQLYTILTYIIRFKINFIYKPYYQIPFVCTMTGTS